MHQIAFIITELNFGGAERCLANLAIHLNRDRFAPQVYALSGPPEAGREQLVRQLAEANVPVHYCGAQSVWQAIPTIRRLRHQLSQQQPTIMQSFLFHANIFAALVNRSQRSHFAAGIRVSDPSRWRMSLERWLLAGADRIVCVSDSVARHAQAKVGLPASTVTVIPNGIDLAPFENAVPAQLDSVGIPRNAPIILSIGRLEHQKGIDWLLRAASELLAQLPNHHLALAGDGPERAQLEEQAQQLPGCSRIHFLGWRADVPELLARSQLLVLPSRWEGMPNVVLEAMAAKRPVVAADTDGVQQLLGTRSDQQVVAFGDEQALVERLVAIAGRPELASELAHDNHRRVCEHFSLKSMVAHYESLYAELLSSVPRS